jgi:dTDP-glucose pyrophosphorylase
MFLMGGSHTDRSTEDYPIYLAEINGELILQRQIRYCQSLKPEKFLFCVKTSDIKYFQVDAVISQLAGNSIIIPISGATKGAICTALLGAEHIAAEQELIVMAVDDLIEDCYGHILERFRQDEADAGVVAFTSVHPRYSFAKIGNTKNVVEIAEKKPISKNALASFYYFKKGADFIECTRDAIRKDSPVNGAFYVSHALNEMILKRKRISLLKIANDKFHPLKTEAQMAQYLFELNEKRMSK